MSEWRTEIPERPRPHPRSLITMSKQETKWLSRKDLCQNPRLLPGFSQLGSRCTKEQAKYRWMMKLQQGKGSAGRCQLLSGQLQIEGKKKGLEIRHHSKLWASCAAIPTHYSEINDSQSRVLLASNQSHVTPTRKIGVLAWTTDCSVFRVRSGA